MCAPTGIRTTSVGVPSSTRLGLGGTVMTQTGLSTPHTSSGLAWTFIGRIQCSFSSIYRVREGVNSSGTERRHRRDSSTSTLRAYARCRFQTFHWRGSRCLPIQSRISSGNWLLSRLVLRNSKGSSHRSSSEHFLGASDGGSCGVGLAPGEKSFVSGVVSRNRLASEDIHAFIMVRD